jgi:3-isopropylmalate/(R)-2-methylmalate dehydratase large subunit
MKNTQPRTLYDRLWDSHAIHERDEDGQTLLFIDRHLFHEGSARAFEIVAERGLRVRSPERTFGVADHYAPTRGPRLEDQPDAEARSLIERFGRNAATHGITAFGLGHPRQGIVHVVGPELGLSLPGMTLVCGDSHTATHGALGSLAFGIGASEVSQVLVTQTLWQKKSRSMLVEVSGSLSAMVTAKDIILAVIGRIGAAGATGHTIEYAGSAIRALPMAGRMTVCNMSIEAGARSGMIAPDDVTFQWVAGRDYAPAGEQFDAAVRAWQMLRSDSEARFDKRVAIDGSALAPMITWGTSPEHVTEAGGHVPDPATADGAARARSMAAALDYMGLKPGMALDEIPIRHVFIGSCTNARLEDLQAAAGLLRGRKVASGVRALVAPGSDAVRREAETLGLDKIFREAGMQWGFSGCSMCAGMNGDLVPSGEHCASTSNRNFVGRQGVGARTHLVSPLTAVAAAVTGRLSDPRRLNT